MKSTYARRFRRRSSSAGELASLKKDNQPAQPFFNPLTTQAFFKPNAAVQRKCEKCESEDKSVKRMTDEKKDDKPVMKMDEKKEEKPVMKMDEKKEEKPVMKMDEKKEEKPVMKMDEKKEEKPVMKMEADAGRGDRLEAENQTEEYIGTLNGKGRALPNDTRQFFNERMGTDFSQVRIHTDSAANLSAKEMNAKAYAVENHIVFRDGQYNPASVQGKKLLAHELTHVAQQNGSAHQVSKAADDQLLQKKENGSGQVYTAGKTAMVENKVAYGCEGVDVQGKTVANYSDSFSSTGSTKPSTKCTDCPPEDCISSKGTIESVFTANPSVTLPSVPAGLTDCESTAVSKFIDTTLTNHEQKHVAAFNTYNGTKKTSYSFTGCQSDLDSYIQSKHDKINKIRTDKANAKSDKLDPFNKPIPCNCKD